jgi:hypothetical protein
MRPATVGARWRLWRAGNATLRHVLFVGRLVHLCALRVQKRKVEQGDENEAGAGRLDVVKEAVQNLVAEVPPVRRR